MLKNSLQRLTIGVVALFTVVLAAFVINGYYGTEVSRDCTVTEKDRVHTDSGSQMRVYTENCGVFEVTDNIFKTDFNSADRFAKIKVGETYDIEHYGWRFGLFSMFPKIESIQ